MKGEGAVLIEHCVVKQMYINIKNIRKAGCACVDNVLKVFRDCDFGSCLFIVFECFNEGGEVPNCCESENQTNNFPVKKRQTLFPPPFFFSQ